MSWSEEKIFEELKGRYNDREWVLLPQVRSATGGYVERTADAIAMNCWRSRGLVLHGFEFKSQRSDWIQELKKPEKAEQSIYRYCDRWWIVTGSPNIVKEGELPPTWGLAAPVGGKLKILVKAPKLQPDPLDRAFIASILRNVRDKAGLPDSILRKKYSEGFDAGYRKGLKSNKDEANHWKTLHEKLMSLHREFEQASGLRISHYSMGSIGELVALLRNFRPTEILKSSKKMWDRELSKAQCQVTRLEKAMLEAAELEKRVDVSRKQRGAKRKKKFPPDQE